MTPPHSQHPAVASPLMTSSDTHPGALRLASLRCGLAACLMLLTACTAEMAEDPIDATIDESEPGSVQQAMYVGTGAFQSRFWAANVRCLDVPGGNFYQGARIQQWGCNYTNAQKFMINENMINEWWDGTVSIYHNGSMSFCLDVAGASKDNGAPVQLWQCNGTDAQRFQWIATDRSDHFLLKNVNSGKCLDLDGAWDGSPYGSKLQQWDCHRGYNQQFWWDRWSN
jgi:hypothetical protein